MRVLRRNGLIELRLTLELDWDGIERVRRVVAQCLSVAQGSPELCDALSMVTAELLENAVKYGKAGHKVQFALEDHPEGLTVSVTNQVDAASDHVLAVRERTAWIDSFDDSHAAYSAALVHAYEEQADGGLGLVRVAYEGGCDLVCHTPSSGEITVSARRPSAPARAPSAGALQ